MLVAWSGAPVTFFGEFTADMWGGTSVADQRGYPDPLPHHGWDEPGQRVRRSSPRQSRNASTMLIEDTLTWLRGKHSFSMGGSWTQYDLWLKNQQLVPDLSLGATGGGLPNLVTAIPRWRMFNAANFPGASADQLNQAQALYAIITGRVTQIQANAGLDEDSERVRIPWPAVRSARACGRRGSSFRTRGASGRT